MFDLLTIINSPFLFLQRQYSYEVAEVDMVLVWTIIGIAVPLMIVVYASVWKVFTKAGEPGWASLIPIYNMIVMLRIAGKPGWWFFLLLIPFANIYFIFVVFIDMAKNFGKSAGFGVGLALLGFIFFPILAFGDARYMPRQYPQMYGGPPQYGVPPQYGQPQYGAPPPYGVPQYDQPQYGQPQYGGQPQQGGQHGGPSQYGDPPQGKPRQ